jgi:hypothetical protein
VIRGHLARACSAACSCTLVSVHFAEELGIGIGFRTCSRCSMSGQTCGNADAIGGQYRWSELAPAPMLMHCGPNSK